MVRRDASGCNLGLFDRYLLKREARRFLEKSARPSSCESPLKLQRYLAHLLDIWKQIANGALSSVVGFLFTTTAVGNGAMHKFGVCLPWHTGHLKPKMMLFSVSNNTMNAEGSTAIYLGAFTVNPFLDFLYEAYTENLLRTINNLHLILLLIRSSQVGRVSNFQCNQCHSHGFNLLFCVI
jgi:hypothetical protein